MGMIKSLQVSNPVHSRQWRSERFVEPHSLIALLTAFAEQSTNIHFGKQGKQEDALIVLC